jgi:hypothetical protein
MGRAGIEPATLGLRVAGVDFGRSRRTSQRPTVEPDHFERHGRLWICIVDPTLTRLVVLEGNSLALVHP